jgi:uncharacterized protein YciI
MNQYIYVLKPTRLGMLIESTPEEDEIVGRHFDHLKALNEQGVMILVGRTLNTDDTTFGIVIFEAEDESAARQIMESDPAVIGGVMTAALYPYRVALMRR